MNSIANRLPALLAMYRDRLLPTKARQAADRSKDPKGAECNLYAGTLRFVGVAEFKVEGRSDAFRSRLKAAAECRLSLFERHEVGEPISPSYLSMLAYRSVLDALASGSWDVATAIARSMGGRPEIEVENDHPFDLAMGYAIKWSVLGARPEMSEWAARLSEECGKPENANLRGYADALRGICEAKRAAVDAGLAEAVRGHCMECATGGIFHGKEDEVLDVWGIGIANLARHVGVGAEAHPPTIPPELLV
jgi:hypothetical protein